MKYKTLIKTDTKEYIALMFDNKGELETFTTSIPILMPNTATMDDIIKLYRNKEIFDGIEIITLKIKKWEKK